MIIVQGVEKKKKGNHFCRIAFPLWLPLRLLRDRVICFLKIRWKSPCLLYSLLKSFQLVEVPRGSLKGPLWDGFDLVPFFIQLGSRMWQQTSIWGLSIQWTPSLPPHPRKPFHIHRLHKASRLLQSSISAVLCGWSAWEIPIPRRYNTSQATWQN